MFNFNFFFITLIFILGPLNVETAMAATAARAQASRQLIVD